MRYQMDNYEQPSRRQMRPTETEDVAVKVRVKGHVLENHRRMEKYSDLSKTRRTRLQKQSHHVVPSHEAISVAQTQRSCCCSGQQLLQIFPVWTSLGQWRVRAVVIHVTRVALCVFVRKCKIHTRICCPLKGLLNAANFLSASSCLLPLDLKVEGRSVFTD